MSGVVSPCIDAIGWFLVHSLWVGTAVALALVVALRLLRGASAQARYIVACVAMALMVSLPLLAQSRSEAIKSARHSQGTTIVRSSHAEEPARNERHGEPATRPWQTRIVTLFPAIVGLWITGASILSLRLVGGWLLARRWVRRDTRPIVHPWTDRLKKRMGIRRAVAFLESARVEVPIVMGWFRPVILVPAAALSGLTPPEMEAILAHELAHIRRHDYIINILQCVVEILMFYHPATWWITGMIRRERENCCDDMAVAACCDRITYARALSAIEGMRAPAISLLPAASGGNLLIRIRRILKPQEESMKPIRMLLGLAVVLAVVPVWLARADDRPATANPATNRALPLPGQPFPNRSFADLITAIDGAPTDKPIVGGRDAVAEGGKDQAPDRRAFVNPVAPGDAPSEAEVLAKVSKRETRGTLVYEIKRENVRIVIEKIADKIDPARVYPLVGTGHLVHRHYKCTVYYDERYEANYPIPFSHVEHKVEVVFIDKDFLQSATVLNRLDDFDDVEAEKVFRIGMYYERVGKLAKAKFYFDKIITRWPNSPWAVKAKARQVQINSKLGERGADILFNFVVGGFY